MRLFTILTFFTLTLGIANTSYAVDEFGARFSADTPSALQDDDPAKALADIMPAAGEAEEDARIDDQAIEAQTGPGIDEPITQDLRARSADKE